MADPITQQKDFPALESWWAEKLAKAPDILAQNEITAVWWGFRLFGDGIVQDLDELNQTLTVIVGTPQGGDVHRPLFSTGVWNFIDYAVDRVGSYAIRESVDAVETWEPRLELTQIEVSTNQVIGKVAVACKWQLSDSVLEGETEVILG